jgi:hypothetical protein
MNNIKFIYKFLEKKFPEIDKVDYGGFVDFENRDTKLLVRITKGVYNGLEFNLDFLEEMLELFNIEEEDLRFAILSWLQDVKGFTFPNGIRAEKYMR